MKKPVVLITGASGEVGRGVVPFLEREFSLRLLAPDAPSNDPRWVRADILDRSALAEAMRGVDAILHLAVAPGRSGTYEDDAFNDQRFDINVKGTHHVFEAAKRIGIRRIVYVSSLMVLWGYGLEGPIPGDAEPKPVGTYALTKALGEQLAAYFGEVHDLEVVIVRIAAPVDPAALPATLRPQQVPFPDLAQALTLALRVPIQGVQRVTIVGESSRRVWDLSAAQRVLGYRPTIRLDDLGVPFAEPFDVPA